MNEPGNVSSVRRAIVGVALCCSVLTSPFLETLAADQPNDQPPVAAAVAESSTTAVGAVPSTVPATAPPTAAAIEPASVSSPAATTAPAAATATTSATVAAAVAATTALPDRETTTSGLIAPSGAAVDPPTAAPLDPQWKSKLSPDYVVEDAGCARDLSAAGLADFFAHPLGPIKGFDEPRMYPLGDGRTMWVLQDAFVDETGRATSYAHMGYANTMVLIQEGTCFTALRRGTATNAVAFEIGTGDIAFDHYFWPAGATVSGGTLQMFWMEMVRDPAEQSPFDGIALHPAATWLATYDIATMQRLSFVPAQNPGVSPVYGYTVVDNGEWSYLFGNSFLQNLALEGGFSNGPHSATRMYLARVPRGHLEATPTYWNGTTWSDDATAAAPISSRYWTENLVMPVVIGDQWVSATKVDGFLGNSISIDLAPNPWGPWTTVLTIPSTPRGDPKDIVTYHASVLPYLDPSGALIVELSQIPMELGRNDAPAKYRPNVFTVVL